LANNSAFFYFLVNSRHILEAARGMFQVGEQHRRPRAREGFGASARVAYRITHPVTVFAYYHGSVMLHGAPADGQRELAAAGMSPRRMAHRGAGARGDRAAA
jgi:hypothetical protein